MICGANNKTCFWRKINTFLVLVLRSLTFVLWSLVHTLCCGPLPTLYTRIQCTGWEGGVVNTVFLSNVAIFRCLHPHQGSVISVALLSGAEFDRKYFRFSFLSNRDQSAAVAGLKCRVAWIRDSRSREKQEQVTVQRSVRAMVMMPVLTKYYRGASIAPGYINEHSSVFSLKLTSAPGWAGSAFSEQLKSK